jgi:hypothetical protein
MPALVGGQRIWQRIYRWDDVWGVAGKDGSWRAERRCNLLSAAMQGHNCLFESVTALHVAAPPLAVDDIWDEEITTSGKITCNDITTITGNSDDILRWCSAAGLEAICAQITSCIRSVATSDSSVPSEPRPAPAPVQRPSILLPPVGTSHDHGQRQLYPQSQQGTPHPLGRGQPYARPREHSGPPGRGLPQPQGQTYRRPEYSERALGRPGVVNNGQYRPQRDSRQIGHLQ